MRRALPPIAITLSELIEPSDGTSAHASGGSSLLISSTASHLLFDALLARESFATPWLPLFLPFFFLGLHYIITRLWVANGDDVGLALPLYLRTQIRGRCVGALGPNNSNGGFCMRVKLLTMGVAVFLTAMMAMDLSP